MKIRCVAVMALGSLSASDAFFAPSFIKGFQKHAITKSTTTTSTVSMAENDFNDDFLGALRPGKKNDDEDEEDEGSGSSGFKDLLKAVKEGGAGEVQQMPHAIENPFLNPPPPPPPVIPFQPLAANPDELSVEEQARLFREMMAQQQGGAVASPPSPLPATQRVAKTDRAGRPVGRNRDADAIANSADLYFAQLKRDSTVRTLARHRGEVGIAEKVFEDEGIRQLDDLLKKNPYLKGQREKDMQLIEGIPDAALAPYFESSEVSEEEKEKGGPSYRKKLMERRKKQQEVGGEDQTDAGSVGSGNTVVTPDPKSLLTNPTTPTLVQTISEPAQLESEPIVQHGSSAVSTVPTQQTAISVPVSGSSVYHPPLDAPTSVPANPEETRSKIRLLMGLLLKHRGGPGFGKGRLKGPEIDRFDSLLQDISGLLRNEAKNAQPVDNPTMSTVRPTSSNPLVHPTNEVVVASFPEAPVAGSGAYATENIDSTIACIEGAITMYKNSPPQLQPSVLATLRVALASAVDTCNRILPSQPPAAIGANHDGRIDNTIAVIDGAITMYKYSPPALKESVLVTLRAALISAVETCSYVLGASQVVPPPYSPPAADPRVEVPNIVDINASMDPTAKVPDAPESAAPVPGIDPNSARLEGIYEKVKAASGDGRLGLRNDLTVAEAQVLADQFVEMRSILMEELDTGIPDLEHMTAWESSSGSEASAASKYQQMLAKARAEKAAG